MINLEEQAMLKTSSCPWINQSSRLRGIFNELTNRTHIDLSQKTTCYPYGRVRLPTGLHKLCYPTIWDRSTWSKLGAYGEHWDIFLFSNFDRCALILRELNQLFIACLFKGSQEQSFFLQTLLYTAFLVTVLKMLTYALVGTWSLVSSGYEHVKRKMYPCSQRWSNSCEMENNKKERNLYFFPWQTSIGLSMISYRTALLSSLWCEQEIISRVPQLTCIWMSGASGSGKLTRNDLHESLMLSS